MSDSLLTNLGFCAVIGGLGGYYLHGQIKERQQAAVIQPATPEQSAVAISPAARPQSASVVSLPRVNGQFFTQARVNSGSVRFLVDTGASSVALTLDDARRAGIDPRALQYTITVNTANGQTKAAPVTLKDVQIGGIRVRNVEGLVLADGLHISLLGMTFLGELQKVEATPTQLMMRL